MANPEHLAILREALAQQDISIWNNWREEHPKVRRNFPDVDLDSANLFMSHLRGANLGWVNLSQADLSQADLRDAILQNAYLVAANIRGADLSQANLEGANLGGAYPHYADLRGADLTAANLRGADLTNSSLVRTLLQNAKLDECWVFGISAWKLDLRGATQSNLIITDKEEPVITVDNLEVAQFIYLLLNNEKIRDVIDTVARKVVLLLGRFTPERKAVLDALRDELRKRDYLPVLFDFDKPTARNITETVRTLAHLSRFIVADLTDPSSIPQELYAIIPTLAVTVQPVLESGQREYSMFVDLRTTYHWVLPIHEYKDANDLLASLADKVIVLAEAKARELEKR